MSFKISDILAETKLLEKNSSSFAPISVTILRSYTMEPFLPILKWALLKSKLNPQITLIDFGVIEAAFFDEEQKKKILSSDILLFSPWLDFLDLNSTLPGWSSETLKKRLEGIFKLFEQKTTGVVLTSHFFKPSYDAYGFAALSEVGSKSRQIEILNDYISTQVKEKRGTHFLIDTNQLISRIGLTQAIDSRNLLMYKAPFKNDMWVEFANEVAQLGRAIKGKVKKVLVLDCDNTLWGGIVGEDGLDGIKLHDDAYPGLAYYRFQQEVLALAEKGVAIVLCSKNNEADVFEVLDQHPHCLIKKRHLSYWKINWIDKVTNLKEIAKYLNVGLDSLVFVDDNSLEVLSVNQMLPEVETVQVPSAIYDFIGKVTQAGFFNSLNVTEEDKKKALMFQQETARKEAEVSSNFENREEFLKSLEIECQIHEITSAEIPRISQLSQKTNQFNFTTLRMTESEVSTYVASKDKKVFSCSVKDRFGDMGLTGVVVLSNNQEFIEVENFFMSCRVLGRSIEQFFVQCCLQVAVKDWTPKPVKARYLTTKKNVMVEKFWEDLNVKPCAVDAIGKEYIFSLKDVEFPVNSYAKIVR